MFLIVRIYLTLLAIFFFHCLRYGMFFFRRFFFRNTMHFLILQCTLVFHFDIKGKKFFRYVQVDPSWSDTERHTPLGGNLSMPK